jgi:hypothetical protein
MPLRDNIPVILVCLGFGTRPFLEFGFERYLLSSLDFSCLRSTDMESRKRVALMAPSYTAALKLVSVNQF